jgi:hypothetical protein
MKKPKIGRTETTEEALALLTLTSSQLIAQGRQIADSIILKTGGPGVGEATTRDVLRRMDELGRLDSGVCHFWAAAIFRHPKYCWTGEYANPEKTSKSHAGREIKVWTLAPAG